MLDGRRSNASQIVNGYLGAIVNTYVADENEHVRRIASVPRVIPRNWFNPNLTFTWFTVPGLIAIVAQLVGLLVTGTLGRARARARNVRSAHGCAASDARDPAGQR